MTFLIMTKIAIIITIIIIIIIIMAGIIFCFLHHLCLI